jgi:hypothetical protein
MTEEKWISKKPELASAPKGDRSARRPQSIDLQLRAFGGIES